MDKQARTKRPIKRKTSKENVNATLSRGKENTSNTPKPKLSKLNPDDAIGMSKQLAMKKKTQSKKKKTSNSELKKCPNGKPMPSLTDLEKMFEDSDEDEASPKPNVQEAITPMKEKTLSTNDSKLLSPSCVSKIADKMMDFISNISDPSELLLPPPVIPPKKRKKTEIPYIVGCKDRPQVIKKPNTNFCKGDSNYGVENNSGEEDECPKKRKKKSRLGGFSKSVFNAQSDAIAERLKENDDDDSTGSSDSSKTIEYDFNTSAKQLFSPLPSTSRDNETFIKNDKLFNESLSSNSSINLSDTTDNDVQIIDVPSETIVLDDNPANGSNNRLTEMLKSEEIEHSTSVEVSHDIKIDPKDDDCCIIVENNSTNANNKKAYEDHIIVDEEYNELEFDSVPIRIDEGEVIDVDSLIAENTAIIKKIQGTKRFDSVIEVDDTPNTSWVQLIDNSCTSDVQIVDEPNTSDLQVVNSCHVRDIQQSTTNNDLHNQCNENSNVTTANIDQPTNAPNKTVNKSKEVSIHEIVHDFFMNNIDRIHSLSDSLDLEKLIKETQEYFMVALPNIEDDGERENYRENIHATLDYFLVSKGIQETESVRQKTQNSDFEIVTPHCQQTINNVNGQSTSKRNRPALVKKQTPLIRTSTTVLVDSTQQNSRNLGDCPICMDSLSANVIASTICGHVFCLKCIKAAVSTSKRCPTCRKVLKGNGYHQLFL